MSFDAGIDPASQRTGDTWETFFETVAMTGARMYATSQLTCKTRDAGPGT
jgi:hypothetical protein